LIGAPRRAKPARMIRYFNIGDRARLPWRFHGGCRSVLAR
jgi:hypothetical protein